MSVKPIPGTAKILAVRSFVPSLFSSFGYGPRRRYLLVHVPTGAAVFALDRRDDVVTVAKELFANIPLEQWQTVNDDTLRRVLEPQRNWLLSRLRSLYESGEARR